MLTALVVAPSPDARRRVGALLRLGGWQVVEAATAHEALALAAGHDLDLVATEVALPGETGLALLARLRAADSRARFLVVTDDPSESIRAAAAGVGALACLAKPVDPHALVDFLRSRAAARHLRVVPDDADVDAGTMDRLQGTYVGALPHRLARIVAGVRAADPSTVAAAAHTLAGASGQLGHPGIARVCQEIAAEARRGVVTEGRIGELLLLCRQALPDPVRRR